MFEPRTWMSVWRTSRSKILPRHKTLWNVKLFHCFAIGRASFIDTVNDKSSILSAFLRASSDRTLKVKARPDSHRGVCSGKVYSESNDKWLGWRWDTEITNDQRRNWSEQITHLSNDEVGCKTGPMVPGAFLLVKIPSLAGALSDFLAVLSFDFIICSLL